MIAITTKSATETKEIARLLAREIAARPDAIGTRGAIVLALSGELGSGKTTFAQGFARALGVKEKIKSPTFVLMKIYPMKKRHFSRLVHIDCYRLHSYKDLLHLGVRDIFQDPHAVILIEWPERVKKIIPRDAIWIKFMHGIKSKERRIAIDEWHSRHERAPCVLTDSADSHRMKVKYGRR